jgi:dTDP-4-amino-4,6-dideoxygalactose transaminase
MIPLSRPSLGRDEARAASRAILAGDVVGRGTLGLELERRIAQDTGAKHALLTTSGTHALELALAALGVGRGDEVVVPSFTFSSVANCVLRQGARPVFADVLEQTLNLDPRDVARRLTKRTKAVIAVHYAGVATDMRGLAAATRGRGIAVIEDAAHAVCASYLGRHLGTIGAAGCFSFHATKNITCGEGGALLTNGAATAHKAELFREKGTNRSAFIRGEVKKYTWVSEGSSYVLSDILTAVLAEQWKKRLAINKRRGVIYHRYIESFRDLEAQGRLLLPEIPAGCVSSYHLFHVLLPSLKARLKCTQRLRDRGIGATFHYQPLHASPFARKTLGCRERLPVSERAGDCLLRLPLYPELTPKQVDFVAAEFRAAVLAL